MARVIHKKARSMEQLHHFRCGKCGKWWTVGDAPRTKKVWFCTWCGFVDRYIATLPKLRGK